MTPEQELAHWKERAKQAEALGQELSDAIALLLTPDCAYSYDQQAIEANRNRAVMAHAAFREHRLVLRLLKVDDALQEIQENLERRLEEKDAKLGR